MAYTGVYVFGDSLVDAGNALKLAEWYGDLTFSDLPEGAPTADQGYFNGRFSNGYTFTDLVANKAIGQISQPVFPYGYEDPWLGLEIAPWASDPTGKSLNFAYGGAHIRSGDEAVPDLDGQTDAFRDAVDGDADPNALYIVTFGGNDVRDLAPTGSDPVPQAEAYDELERCADQLLHELTQLVEMGAQNIAIVGLADVGLIPRYDRDPQDGVLNPTEQLRSDAASDYSLYLDELIRTEVVPALEAMGANVTFVPIMDYVDANGNLVQGALNANLPMVAYLNGVQPDEAGETAADHLRQNLLAYKNLIFFDHVHPNAQAHALFGAYMHAQITNTPWIETKPLLGAEVDYATTATIGAVGEVDKLVIAMVGGTTYTFQMLGVSSVTSHVLAGLGIAAMPFAQLLGDPSLRLLSPTGVVIKADDDSGAGFDASLAYSAASAGTYTLQMSAAGALTGGYVLTASVTGAAMLAGNTYTVTSPSTLVLEGSGGVGQDVVKASVSYALAAGSEIEVLRTTNDKGKTAINLTGNDFAQTLVGNAGSNVLEGKGGADVLTGGAGKDTFVLSNSAVASPGAANIDSITDYGTGDIVDVSQILKVAAGTSVIGGGYLRITTSGLVQVDLDGGGDDWVTLSTINGSGSVAVKYSSGTGATTVNVARVAEGPTSLIAVEDHQRASLMDHGTLDAPLFL